MGLLDAHPRAAAIITFSFPFVGLLLAFTLFSLYTVLMKKALNEGTSPLVLALLRELLATAVLLPAAYINERRHEGNASKFWPQKEDHTSFLLLGLAMIWGVQLLSALSLEHLSANTYALLAPTVPVICAAVAIATGYEPFSRASAASWAKIAAVGVSVLGAAWIAVGAYVGSPSKEKGSVVLGLALLVANKICVATYPVMEKRLMKKYRAFTIVAWGYATGAALVFLSVIPCALGSAALWRIGPAGWTSICYSAFVTSAFNYALMAEINQRTSPLTVMAFYPWQSICTPILSAALLGAPLAASDGIGGFIICVGLFLLAFARWREDGGGGSGHAVLDEGADGAVKVPVGVAGEVALASAGGARGGMGEGGARDVASEGGGGGAHNAASEGGARYAASEGGAHNAAELTRYAASSAAAGVDAWEVR